MSEFSARFGIVCEDPANLRRLRKRLIVADLEVLDSGTAWERGYAQSSSPVAVVPTNFREPTPDQVRQIVATEETLHPIQLIEVPILLGQVAVRERPVRGLSEALPHPFYFEQIIPGMDGVLLERRIDRGGMVTTSLRLPVRLGQELRLASMHIDAWDRFDINYGVANLGLYTGGEVERALELSGDKFHLFCPEVTRDQLLYPHDTKMLLGSVHGLVQKKLARGESPLVYGMRLRGPHLNDDGEPIIEMCIGSRVAEYLHDGSTWGQKLGSSALMASLDSIPVGRFKSLV